MCSHASILLEGCTIIRICGYIPAHNGIWLKEYMFKEGYMIVRMSSSIVSNHGSKSMMGATVNMAITIFGFVLSALFIVVICCRLLCSRFRHRGPQSSSLDNALDRRRPTMSSVHSLDSYICFGIKIFMFCLFRSLYRHHQLIHLWFS